LIAIVGDHGQGMGDHGWWGHGILYQEQLRVPFILSLPGLGGGKRIHSLVRTTDLVPTVLEALGIHPPAGLTFAGESLLDLLDRDEGTTRFAYSESVNDLIAYQTLPSNAESLYAVNDGRWKLIAHRKDGRYTRFELYDLVDDPKELANLSGSSEAGRARAGGPGAAAFSRLCRMNVE